MTTAPLTPTLASEGANEPRLYTKTTKITKTTKAFVIFVIFVIL